MRTSNGFIFAFVALASATEITRSIHESPNGSTDVVTTNDERLEPVTEGADHSIEKRASLPPVPANFNHLNDWLWAVIKFGGGTAILGACGFKALAEAQSILIQVGRTHRVQVLAACIARYYNHAAVALGRPNPNLDGTELEHGLENLERAAAAEDHAGDVLVQNPMVGGSGHRKRGYVGFNGETGFQVVPQSEKEPGAFSEKIVTSSPENALLLDY